MSDFTQLEGVWLIAVYASIGYVFALLVLGAGAITQGIRVLSRAGTFSRSTALVLQALNAIIGLTAVIILPAILGRLFRGGLSTFGSMIMMAVCVVTALLLAKILVHLGLFRSERQPLNH